jgi:hypothetical protein
LPTFTEAAIKLAILLIELGSDHFPHEPICECFFDILARKMNDELADNSSDFYNFLLLGVPWTDEAVTDIRVSRLIKAIDIGSSKSHIREALMKFAETMPGWLDEYIRSKTIPDINRMLSLLVLVLLPANLVSSDGMYRLATLLLLVIKRNLQQVNSFSPGAR